MLLNDTMGEKTWPRRISTHKPFQRLFDSILPRYVVMSDLIAQGGAFRIIAYQVFGLLFPKLMEATDPGPECPLRLVQVFFEFDD